MANYTYWCYKRNIVVMLIVYVTYSAIVFSRRVITKRKTRLVRPSPLSYSIKSDCFLSYFLLIRLSNLYNSIHVFYILKHMKYDIKF